MIPWFEVHVINIGPVPVQVWGFFVALGMSVGTWMLVKALKGKVKQEAVMDLALWLVIGGVIGARIAHVALYEPGFYIAHPAELIKIWHGGLSSFGGFLGALGAAMLYSRTKGKEWMKKVKWPHILSVGTLPFLMGWMIGRVGCVMIHDHPGASCDCLLALNNKETGPMLDMALLEIIGLLPLLLFYMLTRKKPRFDALRFPLMLVYYGVLRFTLDFYRVIDATYLGLTPGQYLSLGMVLFGAVLLKKGWKNGEFA